MLRKRIRAKTHALFHAAWFLQTAGSAVSLYHSQYHMIKTHIRCVSTSQVIYLLTGQFVIDGYSLWVLCWLGWRCEAHTSYWYQKNVFLNAFAGRGGLPSRSGDPGEHTSIGGPSKSSSRNRGETHREQRFYRASKNWAGTSSHQWPLHSKDSRHWAVK